MSNSQLVPGSGILGRGINLYIEGDVKNQVISMAPGGETVTLGDVVYTLPENSVFQENADSSAGSETDSTRSKYDSHFHAKTKIKGKYYSFKMKAEASFDKTVNDENSVYYGVTWLDSRAYGLQISSSSGPALAPSMVSDPDYQSLPDTYSEKNAYLFFRFFQKFGTHFISDVFMGGQMSYSIAVEKGHSYSSEEIKTKMKAEYDGGFFDVKAKAETDWKVANEEWFESTKRHVYFQGGDNSIINAVVPSYGENHNDVFEGWLKSLESNPANLYFDLIEITKIFTGAQADAVAEALVAYRVNTLQVSASIRGGNINLQSMPQAHDIFGQNGDGYGRFQVGIWDRETLELKLAKSWPIKSDNEYDAYQESVVLYNQAYQAVTPFLGPGANYFIVFSAVNLYNQIPPSPYAAQDFYQFLKNCGAGVQLDEWIANWTWYSGGPSDHIGCNYTLMGIIGDPGSGMEDFSHFMGGRYAASTPGVVDYAFLDPLYDEKGELQKYLLKPMEFSQG